MPGVSAPDFLNVKDKGLLGGSDLSVSGGARDRQSLDGRRREQQRRRLEPDDPRLPVGRCDRRVQDPAQQLRRRVRPGRRRPDQHRHPQRHEQVHRQRLLLRPQRRAERDELLHQAGGSAEGPAEAQRLRLDVRRSDRQEPAAVLRVAGVEQGDARQRPGRVRADRGRACRRFQRPVDRRAARCPTPIDPVDRRGVPQQPDSGQPAGRGGRRRS